MNIAHIFRIIMCNAARKPVFGFATNKYSNQPAELQRLGRILKLACSKLGYCLLERENSKGADQPARMCRLVCTLCCSHATKSDFGFCRSEAIYNALVIYIPVQLADKE